MARKQAGPRPLYLSLQDRHILHEALAALVRGERGRVFFPDHAERLRAAIEDPPRKGHHLVKCQGEAHSNPHIDNCSTCAPRWGWCEVPDAAASE